MEATARARRDAQPRRADGAAPGRDGHRPARRRRGARGAAAARNPAARFMGGAWVFPGGAVDAGAAPGGRRRAPRRGRARGGRGGRPRAPRPGRAHPLHPLDHPAQSRSASTRTSSSPRPAGPGGARRRHGDGRPGAGTRPRRARGAPPGRAASSCSRRSSTSSSSRLRRGRELLARAPGREVVAVEPRVLEGEAARVVLPGEPGYDGVTPWVAIGVPIDSVGRRAGPSTRPLRCASADLLARLGARDGGDLDVRIRGDARDPETGVIGIDGVVAVTDAVRAAVRDALAAGERPLVLGGCCTLVPGALAGLRDAAGRRRGVRRRPRRRLRRRQLADRGGGRHAGRRRLRPRAGTLGRRRRVARRPATSSCSAHATPRRPTTSPRCWPMSWPRSRCLAGRSAGRRASRGGERAAERLGRGASGSTSTSTSSTRRRCPRPTTSCRAGWSGTSSRALLGPLGAAPALAGLSLGCVNPEKDPGGAYAGGPATCWPARSRLRRAGRGTGRPRYLTAVCPSAP